MCPYSVINIMDTSIIQGVSCIMNEVPKYYEQCLGLPSYVPVEVGQSHVQGTSWQCPQTVPGRPLTVLGYFHIPTIEISSLHALSRTVVRQFRDILLASAREITILSHKNNSTYIPRMKMANLFSRRAPHIHFPGRILEID